jgi:hypothetical protein
VVLLLSRGPGRDLERRVVPPPGLDGEVLQLAVAQPPAVPDAADARGRHEPDRVEEIVELDRSRLPVVSGEQPRGGPEGGEAGVDPPVDVGLGPPRDGLEPLPVAVPHGGGELGGRTGRGEDADLQDGHGGGPGHEDAGE